MVENNAEFISKEAFLKHIQQWKEENKDYTREYRILELVEKGIVNEPAADVTSIIFGKWINSYPDIEPNPMFMYGICSNCGFKQDISDKLNWCPNCGAKMNLGNKSNISCKN